MVLQQGLTKDNFFDKLKPEHPIGVATFDKWIDDYKVAVEWNRIFKCHQDVYNKVVCDVKFHDLPYAMQFGIFVEFAMQMVDLEEPYCAERVELNDLSGLITDFVIGYENDLNIQSN